jgi:hypothetical protein
MKTVRSMIGYADVGSHGGIFAFDMGPVAERYPGLLQIYKNKLTPDLVAVKITAVPVVTKVRTKPRRGPLRSKEYRTWLHGKICVVAGHGELCKYANWGTTSDAAHTQNNGMRSKGPDSSCVPLCRKHHREYDADRTAFERKYYVSMSKLAERHYAQFISETK